MSGQRFADAVVSGELSKAKAFDVDINEGGEISGSGVQAHTLFEELTVGGEDDLACGVAVTAYFITRIGLAVHPVEITDIGGVAAGQLLGLGLVGLIGIELGHDLLGLLFLGLHIRQKGIAPYARVAGVAAIVVLFQSQGLNTRHGAGQEVGLLPPCQNGGRGQKFTVAVYMEGNASPLHEVARLLEQSHISGEILRSQRRNIKLYVSILVGKAMHT